MNLALRFQFILFLFLSTLVSASPTDAIVKIYSKKGHLTGQGTGFFSNKSGQIITAYHVIEGAKELEIVNDKLGIFKDIEVSYISDQLDVAILQLVNYDKETPYISLSELLPTSDDELQIIAYPFGNPKGTFQGRVTDNKYSNSLSLRSSNGSRLFVQKMDLITIDATIYRGMSGAPVIHNDKVIGILSGSYNEGGCLGWIIPAKYLVPTKLTRIQSIPAQIKNWPELNLIYTEVWKNLRGSFIIEAYISDLMKELSFQLPELTSVHEYLIQSSAETHTNMILLEGLADAVLPKEYNNSDSLTITYLLNPQLQKVSEAYNRFDTALYKYNTLMQQIDKTNHQIELWIIEHQSNESWYKYNRGINEIYLDINDTNSNLYQKLKINEDTIKQFITAIYSPIEENNFAEKIKHQIAILNKIVSFVSKFSSPDAVEYLRNDEVRFRKYRQLCDVVINEISESKSDPAVVKIYTSDSAAHEYTLYHSPYFDFCIEIPSGWSWTDSPTGMILVAVLQTNESHVGANMNVQVTKVEGSDVSGSFQEAMTEIEKFMIKSSRIAYKVESIHDFTCYQCDWQSNDKNGSKLYQKYCLYYNSKASYTIVFSATMETIKKIGNQLDRMKNSFRVCQ